ncbi:3175_t:CDS:2, partial [Entrophospora sp. SA101]
MDRAVKGATKSKCAAPKQKYLEVLIPATSSSDALKTIFASLEHRLRENSWTIVFKSLIVIHILMRKGVDGQVLSYLVRKPNILNLSGFKGSGIGNGAEQTKNIHSYAAYLEEKVSVYRELKVNFVKEKKLENNSRLRRLTVAKGLLREVKILQRQLDALLNCKFYLDEVANYVTLTAFRLIVIDLLVLFETTNEGVINMLEQFVSMSQIDAKDGLEIYKKFVKQTEKVVIYLRAAQKLQSVLGIKIPNLKHAPVSLTIALQDYVEDPNFEANRREYRNTQEKSKNENNNKSATRKDGATTTICSSDNNSNANFLTKKDATSASSISKTAANHNQMDFIDFSSNIERRSNIMTTTTITDTTTNPFLAGQNQLVLQQQLQQSSPIINQQQQSSLMLNPISASSSSLSSDTNPFRSSMLFQDQQRQLQQTTAMTASSPHNPFGQFSPPAFTNNNINSGNNSNPFASPMQQQNLL